MYDKWGGCVEEKDQTADNYFGSFGSQQNGESVDVIKGVAPDVFEIFNRKGEGIPDTEKKEERERQ